MLPICNVLSIKKSQVKYAESNGEILISHLLMKPLEFAGFCGKLAQNHYSKTWQTCMVLHAERGLFSRHGFGDFLITNYVKD